MRRYLLLVMVMVCHDIGIASVMALIVRPAATRRSAPRLGQKWTCQKISLYDLNRRRSFSHCYPGTTQSRNPQPLSLTSTEQRFADGAGDNNQNTTTSWDPPKRRRVITRISSRLSLPSSLQRRLVGLMTGHATTAVDEGGSLPLSMRPGWARDWMPTWMTCLRPSVQLLAAFLLYLFHTLYLTQASIPLPFQLIPNERGNFQSVGLDSLAGMATLGAYEYFRRQPANYCQLHQSSNTTRTTTTRPVDNTANAARDEGVNPTKPSVSYLPSLLSTPHTNDMPWKGIWTSKYSQFTSFWALLALVKAYFMTGGLSLWWEDRFYELAVSFPITVAMHRSLCVLFGHASWIVLGALVLRWIPRPQPFFQQPKSKWFTSSYRNTQWLWWTIGGYFVSSWFFNVTDFVNSYVLPMAVLDAAAESSVVSQLVNPEGQDWLASLVGYVAPCINAPWWEELLYRGFLLPALVLQMRYPLAVLSSGILFSAHHHSLPAFLPLCVLGWTWAILYTKSKNLWTTILIHSMWNSRIFLGSWLGI